MIVPLKPARRATDRGKTGKQSRIEAYCFFLFITPWAVGFLAFALFPILASFYYSLTVFDAIRAPKWIGVGNYVELAHDPLFWQSLKVTATYAVGSVSLGIAASMAIALLLNRNIHGLAVFRTIFYLPAVISGVAVSLLWKWIFQPEFGVLNNLIWTLFHIKGPNWLGREQWVMPAMIVMSLWGIGGGIVIYLARLQGIPTELYEAAEIDGAGTWARILRITVPLMTPVIFFNLIMGIIGSFQVFTQAYVMTNGGPNNASLFYVLYLYNNAFRYYRMGYASALAWILFLILIALTLMVFRTASRWVYYETS